MNLGGLGAFAGGIGTGMDEESRRRIAALQAQALQASAGGQSAAGSALFGGQTSAVPGASPIAKLLGAAQGGQAPASASAIGRDPLATRGGGAQPMPQQPPAQQPQGQPAPQGGNPAVAQAIQQMSFPALVTALNSKPQFAALPPAQKMAALEKLLPMMNTVAQQQYKQAVLGIQKGNLGVRQQQADQQGENIKSEIKNRDDAGDARKQRLALEKQKLADSEAKAASDAGIKTLSQWQAANKDAENERQRAVSDLNNAYTTGSNDPNSEETIKSLKENLASANERIKALHDKRPNVADDVGDAAHETGAKPTGGGKVMTKAPESTQGMSDADKATSIANAKAFIAKNPGSRDKVIERLKAAGIDPTGL